MGDLLKNATVINWAGFLISLPSFVLLFFGPYRYIALVVLVLGLLLFLYAHQISAPAYRIEFIQKTIKISDPDGRRATITLTRVITPLHSHISEFRIRNLSSDGSMNNFCIEGRPVEVEKERGEYSIKVKFDAALPRGKKKRISLTYDCIDSFLNTKKDSTMYRADYFTKHALIEIYLQRPVFRATCVHRSVRGEEELAPPILSENNLKITWEGEKLIALHEYIIYWYYN